MTTCPNCGRETADETKVCPACGSEISLAEHPAPQVKAIPKLPRIPQDPLPERPERERKTNHLSTVLLLSAAVILFLLFVFWMKKG